MAISPYGKDDSLINLPITFRKTWTIQQVKGEDGVAVRDVEVEGVLSSWNYSHLNIPPRFLVYGTYRFTYSLQMLASKIIPLFRTAYTYVQVCWWVKDASLLYHAVL